MKPSNAGKVRVEQVVRPPLTVEQVVALAKKKGEIQVNPLRWRKDRVTSACFQAAKLGLLKKERINAGLFIFKAV